MVEQLQRNIQVIQGQIQVAGQQSVQLIAVTKTVSANMMRQMYQYGQKRFGENRVNVLLDKQAALADIASDCEWHFIGRLQTRQVKEVVHHVDYIHSLDRLKLAEEIQKRATQAVKCFVQVNVSGEQSKAGFSPAELVNVITQLAQYDRIQVVGLMTMEPFDAPEEELHQYFKLLHELQQVIKQLQLPHAPCKELSMGMSQDYQIAIQEGATYVRIGTALFDGIE